MPTPVLPAGCSGDCVQGGLLNRDAGSYTAVPQERIRNFAIVAHVDHGKSTLSDRLLEATGAITSGGRARYLDKLPVERARGITVKAQSASLLWRGHLLQLIDTPGHVDFAHEVARSLAACQGCVLLVDATQGVQAQTMANYRAALDASLEILPVITKCDMPLADPPRVAAQMASALAVDEADILNVSGKTGEGVHALLEALVERLPPPTGDTDGLMRALLLVRLPNAARSRPKALENACADADCLMRSRICLEQDASYDVYRGAVCLVQVVDGVLRTGDRIESVTSGESTEVLEVGLMVPEPLLLRPGDGLHAGMVGYIITSARSVTSARVGDTLRHARSVAPPLPGIKPAKACIFQGIFPPNAEEYESLKHAIEKLTLNDSSVSLAHDTSAALGPGFIAGFLGLLHAEVFHQRLREEYGASVIATAPTVPYRVTQPDGAVVDIRTPSAMPDGRGGHVDEPMVVASLICPRDAVGSLVELCVSRRGLQVEHTFLDETRALLRYRLPLAEIAADFADRVKSLSNGFATFDYEEDGWQAADIVRLDVLVNGEPVDALASMCHVDKATRNGRAIIAKLKDLLPKQSFEVALQAAVRGRVVCRENISAMRKNVLAKCYGGDVSRKKKLLAKQAEGKKRMKRIGSVDVPHEAFADLLRN